MSPNSGFLSTPKDAFHFFGITAERCLTVYDVQPRGSGASACTPLALNGQRLSVCGKPGESGGPSTGCGTVTPVVPARSSHVQSTTPHAVATVRGLSDVTRQKPPNLQDRLAGDNAASKKFKETAERFIWQHSPNATDHKGRKKMVRKCLSLGNQHVLAFEQPAGSASFKEEQLCEFSAYQPPYACRILGMTPGPFVFRSR